NFWLRGERFVSVASKVGRGDPAGHAVLFGKLYELTTEFTHLVFRQRALKDGHRSAANERHNGRNRLRFERLSNPRVRVDVNLREEYATGELSGYLFNDGA